ncbi:LOW QUALITY PROTEIN: hypothetical protein Cgig2_017064 [Carnegiea gigantea]|uniref:Uncharacterized protein n=1 Tax=Carnegiea gigantea TaxID=171969 RepID=A0A9Q1Q6T4_9CARY|nr:LOW QUALITY PROTEIN: hypothetical protein Cgig2_017064 [Carnegiea gigantea]
MDALKNFMSTMTDAITHQVTEQVKRAMEAANSARLLLHLNCIPTLGGEPSTDRSGYNLPITQSGSEEYPGRTEAVGPIRSSRVDARQRDPVAAPHRGQRPNRRLLPHPTQPIPGIPPKQEPAQPPPRDEECSTKGVATIAGDYAEGITRSAWNAQLRSAQQLKSKNLKVNFLVVDVRTAYNVILGRPTLHKRTKRKAYFQCSTFDFLSMAVMKPGLLLKQYHPKFPVSLGALWTVSTRLNAGTNLFNHRMKRKSETVVKSYAINNYTFCGRLVHCGICLGDHEEGTTSRGLTSLTWGRPSGQGSDCPDHSANPSEAPGNSCPSATISAINPSGARPFLLSTDLPGADDTSGDEELVDAPSEDELLDELSEEELEEAPQGICHLHLWAEGTRGGGVLAAGPRGSARFKKRHCIGNLFGFPTFILSGDASHHAAIDKGREARELQVSALYLGAGQPFRSVPTG